MNFRHYSFLVLVSCIVNVMNGQTTLWGGPNDPNSTFSNGIGGWTTEGINSSTIDSSKNAIWNWSSTGDGKNGAYWSGPGIASPTGSTGAMIFNSDFLDNGGNDLNERGGVAPGPHTGALVSPMIDCSTFGSVVLKFNQYFRNYEAQCFVDVSTDGGVSWIHRHEVNEGFTIEDITTNDDVQLIDLSGIAANHDSVKIRFVFDGDYYFWLIDDVSLISLPDFDLSIESTRYPARAYRQPISQICNDTMRFGAVVSNLGAKDQANTELKVELFDEKLVSLFSDVATLTNLASNDDNKLIEVAKFYLPNKLNIGKYYVAYSLSSSNQDYYAGNNVAVDSFEISGFEFALEDGATSGIRANAGLSYSVGALYETSDCWNANDRFIATSADIALASNPASSLANYNVQLYLLKVNASVARDFSNFDKTNAENSTSVFQLSAVDFVGANQANYDLIKVPLTDKQNNTPNVRLEQGTRYIVLAKHPEEANRNNPDTWKFHGVSNGVNYPFKIRQTPVIDNLGTWDFWDGSEAPVLRLNIAINTKIDEKPLSQNVIQLLSNPVIEELKFSLKFDLETNANITIFNQDGKVLDFKSLKNVTAQTEKINVNYLTVGIYYVRVSTSQGTKTLSFMKS